jgi:hypothetical protein
VDHLECWHPGSRRDIEFVDEVTPLSYERYMGNRPGSTCGWLTTRETLPMLIKGIPKTLPRLGKFYMAVGGAGVVVFHLLQHPENLRCN